jgi:hypothetical protein
VIKPDWAGAWVGADVAGASGDWTGALVAVASASFVPQAVSDKSKLVTSTNRIGVLRVFIDSSSK